MSKRYFEYIGEDASRGVESSAKFWEISINGSELTIRFGKIGGAGQTTVKNFDSDEKASVESEKLITAKVKKGYAEKQEV
jgi:predicted DNA-binding WGR domain protein